MLSACVRVHYSRCVCVFELLETQMSDLISCKRFIGVSPCLDSHE
jgi:hypothetical protein